MWTEKRWEKMIRIVFIQPEDPRINHLCKQNPFRCRLPEVDKLMHCDHNRLTKGGYNYQNVTKFSTNLCMIITTPCSYDVYIIYFLLFCKLFNSIMSIVCVTTFWLRGIGHGSWDIHPCWIREVFWTENKVNTLVE